MLAPSLDTVRLFLHILAATVWVGGQIVLAGVVPRLRPLGSEATRAAANGFATVAWPAYVLLWVTGVWNMLAVGTDPATEWHVTLGIKILLVVVAGAAAAVHARTADRRLLAATGAIGAIVSLAALFLGMLLNHAG